MNDKVNTTYDVRYRYISREIRRESV